MQNHTYWHKQTSSEPLYPDFEWLKPEQKSKRGKLGIIGGQKIGFAGASESYQAASKSGVGEIRMLLPDALRSAIPHSITDVIFGPTNVAGSLAKEGLSEIKALGNWADVLLFIGDAGRSSETSIAYESFLSEHIGPVVITRDTFDILRESNKMLLARENTLLVLSFAQLQKLFQMSYYPIVLTFSMHLTQLVEALHKFTITYPISIAVLHKENLIIAHGGEIVTTPWGNPMAIWRGEVASNMATHWIWKTSDPLMCFTASVSLSA